MATKNKFKVVLFCFFIFTLVSSQSEDDFEEGYLTSFQADEKVAPSVTPIRLTASLTAEETTFPSNFSPSFPSVAPNSTEFCPCDLLPWCDVNCCCDSRCSARERRLFRYCVSSGKKETESPNSCFSPMLLYSSSRSVFSPSSSRLLCVARDNTAKLDYHRNLAVFKTIGEVNKVNPRHEYGWTSSHEETRPFPSFGPLVSRNFLMFGDILLQVLETESIDSYSLQSWKLPHALFSLDGICDSFREVKFLQPSSTSCLRYIRSLNEDCSSFLNSRTYDRLLIASVHPSNFLPRGKPAQTQSNSTGQKDPKSIIQYRSSIRSTDKCLSSDDCVLVKEAVPVETTLVTDKGTGKHSCLNAVRGVKYNVVYDPEEGRIITIDTQFQRINLTGSKGYLRQLFRVDFTPMTGGPSNESLQNGLIIETTITLSLSGNPGYLFSKPLLATSFSVNVPSNESNGEADNREPLRIPSLSASDGKCSEQLTSVDVLFGINIRSGCLFDYKSVNLGRKTRVCQAIQRSILQILHQPQSVTHVGIFGNANQSEASNWILILGEKEMIQVRDPSQTPTVDVSGKCPLLVTGFSYEVYFAFVGKVGESQAKVLAVVKKYTTTTGFDVSQMESSPSSKVLESVINLIEVSASVSFFDMTHSTRSKSAPSPVLRLQLPSDFFYPFFVSASSQSLISLYSVMFSVLILVYHSVNY